MLKFEKETGRFYKLVDGKRVYVRTVWEESFCSDKL